MRGPTPNTNCTSPTTIPTSGSSIVSKKVRDLNWKTHAFTCPQRRTKKKLREPSGRLLPRPQPKPKNAQKKANGNPQRHANWFRSGGPPFAVSHPGWGLD